MMNATTLNDAAADRLATQQPARPRPTPAERRAATLAEARICWASAGSSLDAVAAALVRGDVPESKLTIAMSFLTIAAAACARAAEQLNPKAADPGDAGG